jgi:hypothetical protein
MAKRTLIARPRIPTYVQTLATALKSRLRRAEVTFERVRGDRFRFEVIWGKFDSMGHPERQRLVWDIVDGVLEKQDLLNVAMIITLGKHDLPPN